MDSISWKNPVSWILWTSVNILCDGRREWFFTASKDAVIFSAAGQLIIDKCVSSTNQSNSIADLQVAACYSQFPSGSLGVQRQNSPLFLCRSKTVLVWTIIGNRQVYWWESSARKWRSIGPIRSSYCVVIPYLARSIYSKNTFWDIKSIMPHMRNSNHSRLYHNHCVYSWISEPMNKMNCFKIRKTINN